MVNLGIRLATSQQGIGGKALPDLNLDLVAREHGHICGNVVLHMRRILA